MSNPAVSPEDASGFVLLADAAPDILLDVRYYSTYNFMGERVDGYEEPCALMTRQAAEALRRAGEALLPLGYRLKVFDAYRPQRAVSHFMRWAQDPADTRMKDIFYPDLDKERLIPEGFIARRSGHSRGSTVDLTLFDARRGREADMGGPFDFFGERSHFGFPGLDPDAKARRALLRQVMGDAGFTPLPEEWWHFTLMDEPYPDTYFDFPVCRGSLAGARG